MTQTHTNSYQIKKELNIRRDLHIHQKTNECAFPWRKEKTCKFTKTLIIARCIFHAYIRCKPQHIPFKVLNSKSHWDATLRIAEKWLMSLNLHTPCQFKCKNWIPRPFLLSFWKNKFCKRQTILKMCMNGTPQYAVRCIWKCQLPTNILTITENC